MHFYITNTKNIKFDIDICVKVNIVIHVQLKRCIKNDA